MLGDIYKAQSPISHYQPSHEVAELTSYVRKDWAKGDEILNKSWVELNDRSPLQDRDRGLRTFNAFVDESVEDPATAWQWKGTRSKARNKAIQMHAHLTAGYIIPMFMAQNEDDEEDRDFSDMMHDVVEWMVYNSEYKSSFLQVAMGMLVNPVTYLGAEYAEVYQTVKERTEQGYTKKEILDEILSGFQAPVYSVDQVLITNAFEQNIQKQRCIIKRRYIDYQEAEAKYGKHEYWQFVTPGVKSVYSEDDGLFYDLKDDDHSTLVEEAIYLNRRDDSEIPFINGVYTGDADTDANPIRHRNNRNAPMYNVTPFGYQRINEHFFYYKSLMNSQYWDNMLLDEMYKLGMNRAFLDTNMPVAISGTDQVNSDVIFPSSVVAFKDADTKIQPLLPPANLNNIFNGMQIVEASMDESSVSATTGGQLPDPNTKATAIVDARNNAETLLQGAGKTLAESMTQYGMLMSDIVVQHLTTAQIDDISGENVRLKYRTLVLNEKVIDGKQVSKVLRFDEALIGREMSDDDQDDEALALLEESGYPDNQVHLYRINPMLFSRMRYLTRVEPQRMFPQNEEFMQAMYSQIYAQFATNPFVDLETLTRKSLYPFFRAETEELMKKNDMQMPAPMAPMGAPAPAPQPTAAGVL